MQGIIGIVTLKDDLHAKAVTRAISRLAPGVKTHTFEVDCLETNPGLIRISKGEFYSELTTSEAKKVDVRSLDVIWWRRGHSPQLSTLEDPHSDASRLVNRDSQAFVEGIFTNIDGVRWVNNPNSVRRAENKITQLLAASSAGFQIPDTVVTNDSSTVFSVIKNQGPHIVKTLAGLPGVSIKTQVVTDELLRAEASCEASPAIYQRLIAGETHLRILVAGKHVAAASITSREIDSRLDSESRFEPTNVSSHIQAMLRKTLMRLNLTMGIFDLKVDDEGSVYFLEVNQQGQFLYLDVICSSGFVDVAAMHLLDELSQGKLSRAS